MPKRSQSYDSKFPFEMIFYYVNEMSGLQPERFYHRKQYEGLSSNELKIRNGERFFCNRFVMYRHTRIIDFPLI